MIIRIISYIRLVAKKYIKLESLVKTIKYNGNSLYTAANINTWYKHNLQ